MKKKVEKKPTLTQRMDSLESKLSLVLNKLLAKGEPDEKPKKEPDRDSKGNIIKYFKFTSPNKELLQFTEKRTVMGERDAYGHVQILEPPEGISFGRDTDGPPGFYKTADEAVAQRLRNVLAKLAEKRLPAVFIEVTDDPAFADL